MGMLRLYHNIAFDPVIPINFGVATDAFEPASWYR